MWKLALTLLLPAEAKACGVALALIVDVSGSINQGEYQYQMRGLAEALLDPTVRDALVSEQAALTLIQWGSHARQKVVLPWTVMRDDAAVADFARRSRIAPREWFVTSTAIGSALRFTGEYFASAPLCQRHVIDVSGDGPSNDGTLTWQMRDELVARGIVINGIAIEDSVVNVTAYYKANVIGGFGSFVLTTESYEDYPRAIKRKLINEVTKPAS